MSNTVVILVNYKGADDTAKCVRSLLACDEQPSLVVVDNTPNDPELEKAIAIYPDVKLIRAPENLGFGRGNNLGIRWALSQNQPYIFILNNDAQVLPDTIGKLENAIESDLHTGIVAPRIVLEDNPDVLWYGGGEVDWRRGGARVPGVLGESNSLIAMKSRTITFASGCAMFVRREVFVEIGGFDPRFFMYEEDLEFCLRAMEHNLRIKYVSSALVLHRWQGSLRSKNEKPVGIWNPKNPRLSFYVYHIVRNRLMNMWLHAKGQNAIVFLFSFPLVIGWKTIIFIRYGAFSGVKAIYSGIVSFLKDKEKGFINELKYNKNGK